MTMQIRQIALSRLVPHPDHANRMSRAAFRKLMHHIQRSGRYEPLVVRRHPHERGRFQIIHGHHRFEALRTLDVNSLTPLDALNRLFELQRMAGDA